MPFLMVLALAVCSTSLGQTVSFNYDPPEGLEERMTVRTTRVTSELGATPRVDETELVYRIQVERSGDGWVETKRLTLYTDEQDETVVGLNPVLETLKDADIRFEVDADGRLEKVNGYENLAEKAERTLPPEFAEAMAPLLNVESLTYRDEVEWNSVNARFIGRSAKIGEVWTARENFALPTGGAIPLFVTIRFAELISCGNEQCVKLAFRYNTEARDLEDALGVVFERAQPGGGVQASAVSIEGKGERVVNPRTMRAVSHRVERVMKVALTIPGEGRMPVTIRETAETGVERVK